MIYLRYEFNDKAQAEQKIGAINEDVKCSVIKLGKFTQVQGTYDEDGAEIIAPILSLGYAVDVLWNDLDASPYGWKTYEVTPTNPKHVIF